MVSTMLNRHAMRSYWGRFAVAFLLFAALLALAPAGTADALPPAQTARPFGLPFGVPPGPGTWFSGQQHGNTTGAFNFGRYWYNAGQGMHFGIDLSAPCGTPVVAVADGVVAHVDNFAFGIRPHNLVILHPQLGYASLYGHLNKKPSLIKGQPVTRGEVVAETGDPDLTCVSRPHLHLEIRSLDYRIAYNPAALIDADWNMLMSIGSPGSGAPFVKDLNNPNRWQRVDDQPEIQFGGRRLNNYTMTWPLPSRVSPPPQTLPASVAPPVRAVEDGAPQLIRLTGPGCCSQAWWMPDGNTLRFWDGPEGQLANIFAVNVETGVGSAPQLIGGNVYTRPSPDGRYEIGYDNGRVAVRRLADGQVWDIDTNGAYPRFSPGGIRLLWTRNLGDSVPGAPPPRSEIWIANVDGSARTLIRPQQGGSVAWLDDDRLMLSTREPNSRITTISIYTISTEQTVRLISADNMRGVSISPGGRHLLYYLAWQPNPETNGMYLLDTATGTSAIKLPFFGGYRWRDSISLVYIPYAPNAAMKFVLYDIITGQSRDLTDPAIQQFTIANDDWSISPDGRHIAFWSGTDYALYALKIAD
jgi:hypothetical protein